MSSFRFLYIRLWLRLAVLLATAILIFVAFPFNRSLLHSLLVNGRYPPLYLHYRRLALELPHYESYAHSDVKYLWSPNHPSKVGWGNIMQDYILSYVLAYATNRSFVFDDYAWMVDGTPYSHFNGKLIPSRIPLNVFIDGPLAGGALPPGDNTPRAVYKDFFHRICPNPTIMRLSDVGGWNDSDTVKFVIDKWAEKIMSIEDRCLQFEETFSDKQLFNYVVFGKKDRLLSIWPYMSTLPVLSHWSWSPLIHEAFEANRGIVYPPALDWPEGQDVRGNVVPVMPGLLVIHLRRGDFDGHCKYLARSHTEWNAFNALPGLPDKFYPDQVYADASVDSSWLQSWLGLGSSSQHHGAAVHRAHCYPDIAQVVDKVRAVRTAASASREGQPPLDHLYIMTNGAEAWVTDLIHALRALGGWAHIGSSRDLWLTWEQRFVSQALDMLVAQTAQVFIGNGWSSLSSNIVMLRTVDGRLPESNRFW